VKDKRRSDRVFLALPIWVSGTEVTNENFTDEARTVSISRHGATIVLARRLAPVQQITIRNSSSKLESKARIVGQIGGQPQGYVYGVSLLEPMPNIWNVGFPPQSEAEQAVVRTLLECTVCQTREVACMNELEVEVFEANGILSRSCASCIGWTAWKMAPRESGQEREAQRDPPALSPKAARFPKQRKHVRVSVKRITACIRQPGFGEEIVRVDNVSRGGLRFFSPNTYFEGSRIEVAVPYAPNGASIFVAARIVRSRVAEEPELKEYGVAYIKGLET